MSSNNLFIFFFFTYIEISKDPSAKYYQNNKERLQKSLGKISKQQHDCEWYKNFPEDEKQKSVEYRKNIIKFLSKTIKNIIKNLL